MCYVTKHIVMRKQRRSQGGGLKGLKPPLSDQNIDVYFLSFSPTLYSKSRSGALQNVLWQSHRRSNTHSLSNQAVMNFFEI